VKFSITFWDDLGARIGIIGSPAVPRLLDLTRCRGKPASRRAAGGFAPGYELRGTPFGLVEAAESSRVD
jgi:hypothetical protein